MEPLDLHLVEARRLSQLEQALGTGKRRVRHAVEVDPVAELVAAPGARGEPAGERLGRLERERAAGNDLECLHGRMMAPRVAGCPPVPTHNTNRRAVLSGGPPRLREEQIDVEG